VRAAAKYRSACARYVGISRAVADGLRAAGTPSDRLSVIPSAVDFAPLASAVAVASPFPGHPLVGCVAQMTAEKGLTVLAAAWQRVVAARPAARLVLVGDGPERAAVAATLGTAVGTVHFAGFRSDVPAWLKAFTLYVQPSLMEGLGSTVIDALGCGLPVIASDAGGLPEVVGGDGGVLVPPGDPAALAEAIVRLLDDPEAARAFAAAGSAFARRRFTIEAMVAAYAALYRRLGLP
jgi:glycosyltransferase involved in cell wall biosynthesis